MSELVSVTPKQLVVYQLVKDGVAQLKDIAEFLGVPITTVQRHTDVLKMKGLLKKQGQKYSLTEKRPARYMACGHCNGKGVILEPSDV